MHYMKMGGPRVFRFAVRTFAELVKTALEPYDREELGLIIPHQVNQRIIEAAAEKLERAGALIRHTANVGSFEISATAQPAADAATAVISGAELYVPGVVDLDKEAGLDVLWRRPAHIPCSRLRATRHAGRGPSRRPHGGSRVNPSDAYILW